MPTGNWKSARCSPISRPGPDSFRAICRYGTFRALTGGPQGTTLRVRRISIRQDHPGDPMRPNPAALRGGAGVSERRGGKSVPRLRRALSLGKPTRREAPNRVLPPGGRRESGTPLSGDSGVVGPAAMPAAGRRRETVSRGRPPDAVCELLSCPVRAGPGRVRSGGSRSAPPRQATHGAAAVPSSIGRPPPWRRFGPDGNVPRQSRCRINNVNAGGASPDAPPALEKIGGSNPWKRYR